MSFSCFPQVEGKDVGCRLVSSLSDDELIQALAQRLYRMLDGDDRTRRATDDVNSNKASRKKILGLFDLADIRRSLEHHRTEEQKDILLNRKQLERLKHENQALDKACREEQKSISGRQKQLEQLRHTATNLKETKGSCAKRNDDVKRDIARAQARLHDLAADIGHVQEKSVREEQKLLETRAAHVRLEQLRKEAEITLVKEEERQKSLDISLLHARTLMQITEEGVKRAHEVRRAALEDIDGLEAEHEMLLSAKHGTKGEIDRTRIGLLALQNELETVLFSVRHTQGIIDAAVKQRIERRKTLKRVQKDTRRVDRDVELTTITLDRSQKDLQDAQQELNDRRNLLIQRAEEHEHASRLIREIERKTLIDSETVRHRVYCLIIEHISSIELKHVLKELRKDQVCVK